MAKPKDKNNIDTSPLRKPKAKRKLGLKVPPMPMPHIELVQHQTFDNNNQNSSKIQKEDIGYTSTTNTTSLTNTTDTTTPGRLTRIVKSRLLSTSPDKDFQKVPNSVTRDILAKGLFKGKSKQIYDYLWSVSRGAIQPTREVRKTHKEIMTGAGIGSRNTVVNGMKHLLSIGLIDFNSDVGKAQGNLYQVFAPEEIGYTSLGDTTGITDTTGLPQKVVIPVTPLSGITDTTQTIENKDIYSSPKTFFKDFKYIDDETLPAFLKMIDKLSEISEKLTGKKSSKFESETWERLGDLLINELIRAKEKTDSVSSVPAFLTEVLKRKLNNLSKKPNISKGKNTKSDAGKSLSAHSDQQNLPKEELEETLKIFIRNLRDEEGLESLIYGQEKIYSEADWRWLMKELETEGFTRPIRN
ncbi:MAG: hypothetical protein ACR2MD_18055 [Aridibacter sp.]